MLCMLERIFHLIKSPILEPTLIVGSYLGVHSDVAAELRDSTLSYYNHHHCVGSPLELLALTSKINNNFSSKNQFVVGILHSMLQ